MNDYLQQTELNIESIIYKRKLEARLIQKFKLEFKEKIGYEPQVLTLIDTDSDIPSMPILTLRDTIDEILLDMYGDRKFIHDVARLRNRSRKIELVNMRFIYFKLARLLGNSLDSIGDTMATFSFPRYDHTTVLYGISQFDNLIERDEQFKELYLDVIKRIKAKYKRDDINTTTNSKQHSSRDGEDSKDGSMGMRSNSSSSSTGDSL